MYYGINTIICLSRMGNYTAAFSVVPVGHTEMPGPISITYDDAIGPVETGDRNMLVHWNPS